MIIKIYCYKDVKLGVFENPFYALQEPEDFKEIITRGLKSEKDEERLLKFRDLNLFYLGTFNDKNGVISLVQPVLLMQLDEVVAPVLTAIRGE